MVSPISTATKSYDNSRALSCKSLTSSKKVSLDESGSKSAGCHICSTGFRYSAMSLSMNGSRYAITSLRDPSGICCVNCIVYAKVIKWVENLFLTFRLYSKYDKNHNLNRSFESYDERSF